MSTIHINHAGIRRAAGPDLAALAAARARIDRWRRQLDAAARTPAYPFDAEPALGALDDTLRRLDHAIVRRRALS